MAGVNTESVFCLTFKHEECATHRIQTLSYKYICLCRLKDISSSSYILIENTKWHRRNIYFNDYVKLNKIIVFFHLHEPEQSHIFLPYVLCNKIYNYFYAPCDGLPRHQIQATLQCVEATNIHKAHTLSNAPMLSTSTWIEVDSRWISSSEVVGILGGRCHPKWMPTNLSTRYGSFGQWSVQDKILWNDGYDISLHQTTCPIQKY